MGGVCHEYNNDNTKFSSNTQYKEFYILCNSHFIAADKSKTGTLNADEFNFLIEQMSQIPKRFGYDWYDEVHFSDVAVNGRVSWKQYFDFNMDIIKKGVASFDVDINDNKKKVSSFI